MPKTPLYDVLVSSGAQVGEYGTVETARDFGDVGREFRELTLGCAVYDLGWRAKIVVAGQDRVRWLNGMVTNNIKDLPLNQGNYSFILNPQGRILGDLYTYNRGDYLLIDTERSQLESLLKLFDHFIIMDDVDIIDKSAELTAIGIQGPNAGEILKHAAIHDPGLKPMQLADLSSNGIDISITRMASDEFVTYELWVATANAAQLWKVLVEAGAVPVGSEAREKFRVMIGFPKYGTDIRERDLPQETEQDHALNFTKGCYIGQEIVERIRSRGAVHRTFRGFLLNGEFPGRGSRLVVEGKDVGEITSVSRIPAQNGERAVALGYIRREVLERGARITYPGGEAKPSELPFSLAS
jgi:folate-binding protein YgfZ